MDILYVVKPCTSNEELKYSLRSLENLPHDKVFIAGGCPNFINKKKVKHIDVQPMRNKYNTTSNNILQACKSPELSNDFILMNDDFYILKQVHNPRIELNVNLGKTKDTLARYKARNGGKLTTYARGYKDIIDICSQFGINDPLDYELHIPMVMNKLKYMEMLSKLNWASYPCFHKRTLYGNLYNKCSYFHKDVKVFENSSKSISELNKMDFLSSSDRSWPVKIYPYLGRIFLKKSIYEL